MEISLHNYPLSFLKYISLLLIGSVFLFFIGCGGGDPWAIPEEYQNLTLEQLKEKSTIQNTYEGLILAKDTAEESKRMTTVGKGEELKPNKDRFGELAYFESEVDDAIQRKDDPSVFDVWICIGEKIDRKDINNTCDDFLFLKYKDDRGPKIKTGDQVKFAGVFDAAKTKRIGSGAFRNENTLKTFPQFRVILLEIIK